MASTPNTERDIRNAALDQLHAAQQRIAALETQLKAAREEIRRYCMAKMDDVPCGECAQIARGTYHRGDPPKCAKHRGSEVQRG